MSEGKGWREVEEGKERIKLMGGDLTWGTEHTVQHTDEVLENCAPRICRRLLTKVYTDVKNGSFQTESVLRGDARNHENWALSSV